METTNATLVAPSPEVVRKIAERYREPDWLRSRRLKALDVYHDSPLPDPVTHLWRYTDSTQFVLENENGLLSEADGDDSSSISIDSDTVDASVVLSNGRLVRSDMSPDLKSKKVILMDLHQAAHEYPSLVEHSLGKIVPETHGKFEALNLALWQGGLFLHVPRNVWIEKPIHVVISGDGTIPFLAPRLLVVAEEGAEITLVVEFASPKDSTLYANAVIELIGGRNSSIKYIGLQRWSDKTRFFLTQRTRIERDGQFLNLWAGLGSRVTKSDIGTILNGPGANVRMYGVTFGHKKQHFDQHTEHIHRSGDTNSDLNFKVVLKDKSRSAYTGLIRIDEHATNCEAFQENRNLVVNDGPRVDTIPELEILNDEVKCSHGATIGPIDPMQLFYLEARGIRKDEAIRLIVAGFVESTLNEMPENLRERLHEYVEARLKDI